MSHLYTCPMHPEIQQDKPGSCPICGMALQEIYPDSQETSDPELLSMNQRFWISLFLTIPLILVDMFHHVSIFLIPERFIPFLEFLLATPVVLWGGYPFFQKGISSLQHKSLNMFTLIGLGISTAYIYSVIILFMGIDSLHQGIYFESAATITTLVLLGQVLELKARNLAQNRMRALLKIYPQTAIKISGEEETEVPLSDIKVKDLLRVIPGAKIPVDGIITDGSSSVDQSPITGESLPISVNKGDNVIGGSINAQGTFIMRAEHVGDKTMLSQIVHLVSKAQLTRAPIQRLADTVSGYFVPIVILVAFITALIWGTLGPEPKLTNALVNAVAVLIIACPCALGLATPMSIMVATSQAARAGILIRKASALENMNKVDTLVVDKTGTITVGKPRLASFIVHKNSQKDQVFQYIASLERNSEHPLAQAVVIAAKEKQIQFMKVDDFHSHTGRGIEGTIKGKKIAVGSPKFLEEKGISMDAFQRDVDTLREKAETVLVASIDETCVAVIGITDTIRPTSKSAIQTLQKSGIKVIMLTGDNQKTADHVAQQVGISMVKAEVLPQEKYNHVKELQEKGYNVAMIGDGINDAPALAQANVGIAMGTGTDVTMETADITLMTSDLNHVTKLIRISNVTMRNIRENLFFAFIYNTLGIPIAAGILYPHFGILLSPVLASAMMSLSSVSVILNSLRLSRD